MWPFSRKQPKEQDTAESLLASDLREVVAIEKECFGTVAMSAGDFVDLLNNGGVLQTSEDDKGRVIGYAAVAPIRRGWRIKTIAVRVERRRGGVAAEFVEELQEHLENGMRLVVTVSERNTVAHLFWRAMGFRATVKRRHYNDNSDAYVFRWERAPA